MLRATFDLPRWLADDKEEQDELESVRELSLERVADAAAAMVGRFTENMAAAAATAAAAAAATAGGSGKAGDKPGKAVGGKAAAGERVSAAVIEDASETLARAQAYAALRRHGGCYPEEKEDWSRERWGLYTLTPPDP
jgi:hypothetical protein